MNDSFRSRAGRCLARTTLLTALLLAPAALRAQHLLVPMDQDQDDHLKAYGLTYWSLERGATAEWLLNYRDGAFLCCRTGRTFVGKRRFAASASSR